MKTANQLVWIEDGVAVTNTIVIAEKFNKSPNAVQRSVRRMLALGEATEDDFIATKKMNLKNYFSETFNVTRQGFAKLIKQFRGIARQNLFTAEYEAAYDKTEAEIAKPAEEDEIMQALERVNKAFEASQKVYEQMGQALAEYQEILQTYLQSINGNQK